MYGYLKEHVGAFGPHEIRTLIAALDKAWESIQASGIQFVTGAHAEAARAVLAKHIIEAAKQGELDQRRLRDGALVAWAQSNLRKAQPHPTRQLAAEPAGVESGCGRRDRRAGDSGLAGNLPFGPDRRPDGV
jgi:hypothetical protein